MTHTAGFGYGIGLGPHDTVDTAYIEGGVWQAETLAEMARRHVAVEIALTSNDVILGVKGEDHPFRAYRAAGVPLVYLGAEPPAPVSNRPPPCISGTIESILALVPSSRIGNRSVR